MQTRLSDAAASITDLPLFCARQAREWGISPTDLRILMGRGLVLRVDRGWYSTMVAAEVDTFHVLRTVAALRMHDHAAAAGPSAALLHGLPLARAELGSVELIRMSGHGCLRDGVRASRHRGEPLVDLHVPLLSADVRAVDVPTAVVGTALLNNPVAALVAGDFALHTERCTRADIEAALHRARGRVGVERARTVLQQLDGRHESPGETVTHLELRRLGWDLVPQWWVRAGGRRYRLDFRVRGYKLAVEFDGEVKYLKDGAREAQDARQEHLEAQGWVFVRFVWADHADPGQMHQRMHEALALAPRDEDEGG